MGDARFDDWRGRRSSGDVVNCHRGIVERLARVSPISSVGAQDRYGRLTNLFWRQGMFEVAIDYHKPVDIAAERERLTKDLAKFEKEHANAERQLGNEGFLGKAPAHVVESLRKRAAELVVLIEKTRRALDDLT
jgi:valyl-tRNA synthetase